jgi:chromosome segregation ATPase
MKLDCRQRERELTAVTEQRDYMTLRLGETQERMIDAERQRDRLADQIEANHKGTLMLERMVYQLREQNDRLAEAIRKHRDELKLTSGECVDRILWNTLAAVKGGSDE